MKRFLAGLVLAAVMLVPASAHATIRFIKDPLVFKTNINGKLADSTTISFSGSAKACTTQAFSARELLPAPFVTGGAATAGIDSTLAFIAHCDPVSGMTGAATIAADTVYFTFQVSHDGANWITCTSTGPITTQGAGSGIGGSAVGSTAVVEAGTTNCFAEPYDIMLRSSATSADLSTDAVRNSTAPTDQQWFGFDWVRFIVTGDMAGPYNFSIDHWADVEPNNRWR